MLAEWEPNELIDAWTLTGGDWDLIANKAGVTRLGFAVMLKFYEMEGRFPAYREEVPRAAVDYLGSLVKVEPALFARYSWRGRTIEYHRAQIRRAYVTWPPTEADEDRWAQWLAEEICPTETNRDRLAAALRRRCLKDGRAMRIETVINAPRNLQCNARLPNLAELQDKARACNRRILDVERAGQGTVLASPAFERIAHPSADADGRRTPALRFGDPRVMALAGALCATLLAATGITNKSLRALMTGLLAAGGRAGRHRPSRRRDRQEPRSRSPSSTFATTKPITANKATMSICPKLPNARTRPSTSPVTTPRVVRVRSSHIHKNQRGSLPDPRWRPAPADPVHQRRQQAHQKWRVRGHHHPRGPPTGRELVKFG